MERFNLQKEEFIQEDEIDLRELILTIWSKKVFIISFTLIVTIIAIIYAYMKTPVYEVQSVVKIGHINQKLLENGNIIEKKLRLIFNVDSETNRLDENHNAIVSDINFDKKIANFISISTQAFSNEEAIKKNKKVVEFLQNEYKYKIDEFILKTKINIKDKEEKINYINNVEKINIEKEIEKIKTQSIPKVYEEIKLIKNVDLKSIDNEIKFQKEKLNKYQQNIDKISKNRKKIKEKSTI